MCQGNNASVIDALQGTDGFGVSIHFSWIMSAINDRKLYKKTPKFRAMLVDLLKGDLSFYTYICMQNASMTLYNYM